MRIALVVALALSTALLQAQAEPTLEVVLGRMHAYLKDYAKQLPAMIATERYQQRFGSGMRKSQRLLMSDYGLIQVQGDSEWLGFREVLSVDGKPVTDSARRLAELLAKPSVQALQQARLIAEESARYNIGPVVRTINDPALVLELLDGRQSPRMRFSHNGENTINGVRTWVLRYQELGNPTIIRTRDRKDVPARGRAWVEPDTGRILRAEASVEPGLGVTGTIDVTFEFDERMGFAVPSKMSERYTNRNLVAVSSGEATYSNYRRFTVDTEENIQIKP
ncbi:MAG TPA: hypothetical protein VL914_07710 [Vicinamibacterales bacterium]|nr:hypothetical protein [Vicinamibacterales bacterium]